MKKLILFFIFMLFVVSCSLPSHSFQNPKQTGVNFSDGKWLLNTLDAPEDVSQKLEQKIIKDFSESLATRLTYYPNSKGLLMAQKIEMQLDKRKIRNIKVGTGYDYFINIKAEKIKDDLGAMSFKQNNLFPAELSNSSYVEMEIYDLNREIVIYSQKVISSTRRSKDNDKIHFSKSSNELLIHAYEKLFQDLKKNSIE